VKLSKLCIINTHNFLTVPSLLNVTHSEANKRVFVGIYNEFSQYVVLKKALSFEGLLELPVLLGDLHVQIMGLG
jgi:hypothetical protein